MAAKGGGAWKVAYADFVTAMMAFFLVMWICGQDQQVKHSIAQYFQDPVGVSRNGNAKAPSKSGSVSQLMNTGTVPESESVAMGQGRSSHSDAKGRGRATKLVSDWIQVDKKVNHYWRDQAHKHRELARNSKEVRERFTPLNEVAAQNLASQLREEIMSGAGKGSNPLFRDLLRQSLSEVNWYEVAEDLMPP